MEISVQYRPVEGGRFVCFLRDLSERTRAAKELQDLHRVFAHLIRVRDLERERISGELHENVAQYLAGVGMYIFYARNLGVAPNIEVQRFLDDGYALLRQCSSDMQTMAADLYPSELKNFELIAAIKSRVSALHFSQGIDVNLNIPRGIPRLHPDHELALYRAMEEALTNVCRRPGGMAVTISVLHDAAEVELKVFNACCELPPVLERPLSRSATACSVGAGG